MNTTQELLKAQGEFLMGQAMQRSTHTRTLRRRLEWLEAQLMQYDSGTGAAQFMRAERAALRWAIDELERVKP